MLVVHDDDTQAALDALAARLGDVGRAVVVDVSHKVQSVGMRNTPVRTGTLRRSWVVRTLGDGEAWVGPTTVYARRIELGFLPPLRDRIGRSFPHDQGHPYVGPSALEALPSVEGIAVRRVMEAIYG